MCTSRAWAKPAEPPAFAFCENGAKSTLRELTTRRAGPDVFAGHGVAELRGWHDRDLGQAGRLTRPMRFAHASDRYVPVDRDDAFAEIGAGLRATDPEAAVFRSSGHAGLEASYLCAPFARALGQNTLPQSSNRSCPTEWCSSLRA